MFSATIDQIRLRRATNFPVDSQNAMSSGLQSEIQVLPLVVGSLTANSFLRWDDRWSDVAGAQDARRCTLRRHPSCGGVTDRMAGFRRTASMASASTIQASCQGVRTRKLIILQILERLMPATSAIANRMEKLRFGQRLCDAQSLCRLLKS